jgi:quercetin dioxygenase-like cupin family protein
MLPGKWSAFFPVIMCLQLCGAAGAEEGPAIRKETLLRTGASWDGTAYRSYPAGPPEISVVRITIPPHTAMAWHTHPMPNVGYVLSGDITVERKDGAKRHITAGQALPETVGSVHRGVTGDSEAVLVVFYAGVKGLPLSQPEHKQDSEKCPKD